MSKEEFLKIQTCVLKVNIHCDGCKHKVKKILQKIDGVYTTNIDSEQGKVTVSGNVDPATLIKKLTKNGKHAEIWGASKANNNNQNQMNNQFKNLQIDNGSKGGKNKGQTPKGGGNNQPQGGLQAQNPQFQQLQQMQQLKGLQDLKIPPQFMKDPKGANNNKDQNQKSVKFSMPEDEEFSDDDFDDEFDDEDDDFDDEMDDIPVVNNKMKPPVLADGHGGAQMGNIMMNNIMNGQHLPMMKGSANNGQKGGGGNMPVQMNLGGGNQNQGGAAGGKKGGNGNNNGGNQNQGGSKGGKNGGGQPNDGKNGGGGQNKNGGGAGGGGGGALNGNNSMGNGAKKGGGGMNGGPHGMPNMMPMSGGGNMGPLGANMPMGQMGHLPMGQMNNLAAVQGLPASAMTGGGGGGAGAGYFPAPTPEQMTANPYHQQQLAAMMMNQQRANGNERFQPMMYARPPPAVNYMPPYPTYPYSYPYAPPHGERIDQYTMFSDENTSSCNVM